MPFNMFNLSEVTTIYLAGYYGMDKTKEWYFLLFFITYLVIIAESVSLIAFVCSDRSLHEPMYILMCNLAVNGLYGGTALLPGLLSNVLSRSRKISLGLCQTQLYVIHTYAIIEFTILAAMSYDRYMAICSPLTYHTIMPKRVFKLIILTWIYPLVAFLLVFVITLRLKICKKTIDKVYCLNFLLVQLSCSDTTVANITGLISVVLYTGPQLIMVMYSYGHILRIWLKSFSRSKMKALKTCIPHLVSLSNYSVGCFFEIAQSRFKNTFSYKAKLFLALYFLIFPPILNPLIYGLSMKGIKVRFMQIFTKKLSIKAITKLLLFLFPFLYSLIETLHFVFESVKAGVPNFSLLLLHTLFV